MASRKKKTEEPAITEKEEKEMEKKLQEVTLVEEALEATKTKEVKKNEKAVGPKYPIGSIVYVQKNADADLNGFKLFPQYKKYTYTVEAYDAISGVYTLRKLNLSLLLKEADIINPDERAHDELNRIQF